MKVVSGIRILKGIRAKFNRITLPLSHSALSMTAMNKDADASATLMISR